jgi:hypothetical protein
MVDFGAPVLVRGPVAFHPGSVGVEFSTGLDR